MHGSFEPGIHCLLLIVSRTLIVKLTSRVFIVKHSVSGALICYSKIMKNFTIFKLRIYHRLNENYLRRNMPWEHTTFCLIEIVGLLYSLT